jgi:ABC-type bacteriocin/lantibiotic exporter with double-glycine peptidase domain
MASFLSADISWLSDAPEPVLLNLNLNVKSGFTAIVGPVGSGKSTLLETLIGETIITRGRVVSNISKVAFCSQSPWITDDTIRHNIVGTANLEFDPKWYEFSVASCGLQQDLAGLPAGDQTVAGSNGLALSGGQRQRVVCDTNILQEDAICCC